MKTNIDFSNSRWEQAKENYALWCNGALKRPIIQLPIAGRDPGRPEPRLPFMPFTAGYDLSIPEEDIVDRWDYDLSCAKFIGDTFPSAFPNFGAGVAAAFLGAVLQPSDETVWFHPLEDKELSELQFRYDPDNKWLQRIKNLSQAAMDRWEGFVQIGMTDIGGNLDIISSFRPGEKLLLDLYDNPEEVKRRVWEVHDLWSRYYDEMDKVIRPLNQGFTHWMPLLSPKPFYMLQCDFAYMISPEMFDEFVRPELVASCRRFENAFYHLDGQGQLPHLDSFA